MIRRLVCFFILALTAPSFAHAVSPASLSELIVLVLETNLGLRIEQLQVETVEQSIAVEDAVFDPTLFSALHFDRRKTPFVSDSSHGRLSTATSGGQVGIRKRFATGASTSLSLLSERRRGDDMSSSLDPEYRSAVVLELTQPLLRDRGVSVNTTALQRAYYQLQQTQLDYLLKAQNLAVQLEQAVRELALSTRIVQLRDQALDLADELVRANQARFNEGLVPVTEVQGAEAARAARQLQQARAVQQKELILTHLNRQLDWQLPASFDPLPLLTDAENTRLHLHYDQESSLETARRKRLDVKRAEIAVDSQLLRQNYLENQLLPQLDVRMQAGLNGLAGRNYSNSSHPFGGNWFDSVEGTGQADGYQWGIALEVQIPIGNRAARSRYRQAQLTSRQLQYRQADLDAQLQLDVREQLIQLNHSARQLTIATELEQLAHVALQQEQRRVEEGLSDTFRLLSFQDDMINARINRQQALTQYHTSLAFLAYVRGEILERYNIHLPVLAEGL